MEKPILFNGEMVRAILNGRKSQTRRPIKPQPPVDAEWDALSGLFMIDGTRVGVMRHSPYVVGDRLWVRETFALTQFNKPVYRADCRDKDGYLWPSIAEDPEGVTWKPSIHIPRWASRITLEVTGVRVERLRDISMEDAIDEGKSPGWEALWSFQDTWDSIYAKRELGWDMNPWLFVYTFKVVTP